MCIKCNNKINLIRHYNLNSVFNLMLGVGAEGNELTPPIQGECSFRLQR